MTDISTVIDLASTPMTFGDFVTALGVVGVSWYVFIKKSFLGSIPELVALGKTALGNVTNEELKEIIKKLAEMKHKVDSGETVTTAEWASFAQEIYEAVKD